MTPAELKLMDQITELELLLVDAKFFITGMKLIPSIESNKVNSKNVRIDWIVSRIDKALET